MHELVEEFTYLGHSAISATHISLDTSCLLQPAILAFSGNLYSLVRIFKPLPQLTEHLLQSEYSVTSHSTKKLNL